MKFPNCLVHYGGRTYSSERILSFNIMFARHPKADWDEGEDFPEFGRISSTQSFNWSVFSIPIWARFNDKKEYKEGYGIVGYKVRTIRNTATINPKFENGTFELRHDPIKFNYSHCALNQLKKVANKDKRDIRMTFKHQSIIPVLPGGKRKIQLLAFDYLRMHLHRSILKIVTIIN